MKCEYLILLLVGLAMGQDYEKSNLQFTTDIYTKISSKNDGNFLVCPLSAHIILSLATIGARGETAQELTSALHIPSEGVEIENMFKQVSPYLNVDKDYQLSSANKIYVREDIPLKNDFKTSAQNTFQSEVQNIDFKNKENATNEINQWVEMKTQDKIKNLLSDTTIKADTAAVLVNAIFFKGKWINTFGKPRPHKFYVSKTETLDADMMTQRNDFNYYFDKDLNAEYMEFPFIGDDVVMTIALPKENNGLINLEKSISNVILEKPYNKVDAIAIIPKFTMESDIDFKSILESLGVTLPFTNSANLSGISNVPLAIDEVVQKTFIEVNELGVTAAGATKMVLMAMSAPRVNFYANRPFIYYLKHKQFSSQHDGNFMVCPLSAHTILSLAAIGAKEQTAKELTSALRIPSDVVQIENMFKEVSSYLDVDEDYQLTSANKIYVREDIQLKNDFKTIAQNGFKSEVENINFKNKESATNEINRWVELKTHDKIKNLLSESTIKPNTIAILINAIFFKGKWVKRFGKAFPHKFFPSKNETAEVYMMMQRNKFNYYFDKDLNAEYMEFPFVGEDVVMTIVLPKEIDEKPYQKFDSLVIVPKFTIESKINFKSIMESLGVTLPFTNSANFSGISNLPLAIDEIVQKTFIEVNELGVTAAGATEAVLMAQFSSQHDGNFLVCPLSAHTILSLAAIGAKEQTAKELTSALRIPSDVVEIENMFKEVSSYLDVDKDYQLSSANKIYIREDIELKNDFKTIAQNTFKSEVENINFKNKESATNVINKWVEMKTQDKIKNLLSESTIKPNTIAILINAIFFKGKWVNKFGKAYPRKFYVSKTDTVDVDMMMQRNHFFYHFDKELDAQYMELPFVGDDVVMTIVLPKEKDGLNNLEKSMATVLSEKPYEKFDSIVSIPKFTMESKIDFKSILESLGVIVPFTNSANFSGISNLPLAIDEVVQKTFIEVNEHGVTAAGATEIDIQLNNDFKTIARNTFKSEIQNINFKNKKAATNEINKWVEMKTNNKIKNLLSESSIKSNTAALLINAVFFKGKWVSEFGEAYPSKFYVSKTETVDVNMMMQRNGFHYYFDKDLNTEYMEFPFVGDDVVMTIALPKEKDGLSNLEKSISTVISEKPYKIMDSIVTIPKFTMESKINFKSILESLGVIVPFTNSANFSGISDATMAIDEVVQKTFIEVNEFGVTAAGATEILYMVASMPQVDFNANRPFIYYLKHKVHGIFFVGRYTKP
ncbi:hypothetical protein FQR65_LT09698 [Abscondita terminalis]|nr:hypothetical protein FQR65_LT09698 [Abscondita terminalis]